MPQIDAIYLWNKVLNVTSTSYRFADTFNEKYALIHTNISQWTW